MTGKQWRSPTVRNLLRSARIAGLREHQGQVIGKAAWPAIITPEQHKQAVAILSSDYEGRRYLCRSGADFGGSGKITITAPAVEELIYRSVLMRLDSDELAETLAGR